MLDQNDIQKIKEATTIFFTKTTIPPLSVECSVLSEGDKDSAQVDVKLKEPQILIGEKGQTLFEAQRILKIILNKKLQKIFYLNLDINDYKKTKSEYLKEIAKDLADEVAINKREKVLSPMSAYERRIIHAELAKRQDVITESSGDGFDRHIIIKPR